MILDKKIPISYWFNKIKWDILWNIIIVSVSSLVVYLLSTYCLIDLKIPISIAAFLGTAIALLLSFKLSQSYDRWWEGRKIWGAIVNDSRTLVMQVKHFTKEQANKDTLVHRMAYRQIAWCYSLSQNLRKQNALENLASFISEEELEKLKHHKNVPLALLDNHGKDLKQLHAEGYLNDFQHIQIDSTLVRFCESMGKAERIKNTAFPKTYRVALHVFIYIFLVTLAFSLAELHFFTKLVLLISISTPFFLLEGIAYNIQDPFENRPTDTAMTSISTTIEINIKQLLNKEDIPEPLSFDKFYIL